MRARSILAVPLVLLVAGACPPAASAIAPLERFGSGQGTAAGQLDNPSGIAVDPAGNVYVADVQNRRVSVFSPQGGFLRAFGKDVVPGNAETGLEVCTSACQRGASGDGPGEINQPISLVFDAAGRLHVGETANNRVSVFTSTGTFLRAFGKDVVPGNGETGLEICTTACQGGAAGTGAPGEFRSPDALATDAADRLYVADPPDSRIAAFSPGRSFLRAFGKDVVPGNLEAGFEVCTATCKAGAEGGGPGELGRPVGLDTDAASRLYVADSLNSRVAVYSPETSFVRAFGKDVVPGNADTGPEVCSTSCKQGTAGSAAGELTQPRGAAADTEGDVYVSEGLNRRVSVFTAEGAFLRAFGKDVVPGNAETGFEVCTAECKAGAEGSGPGELSLPQQLALDCRGAVYVVDGVNGVVQKFGEPGTQSPPCGGSSEPAEPSNEFSFGKVKKNKRKGTAKLTVEVPGPGELELARTKKLKRSGEDAEAARKVKLTIRSRGMARKRLDAQGKARVNARVAYIPTGGEPNTKSKRIKLKKRLRPRGSRR
ncbi:MAG: NHL repeat-containing protein [Solirubrobacterales bacterium]